MQPSSYGPAQSPPLHHPVPQHVSSVPQLRSPPPPQPQSQPQAGYGGYDSGAPAGGGGGAYGHPAFGGFMNEGTAQMAFNLAKSAGMGGQEYIDQNVCIQLASLQAGRTWAGTAILRLLSHLIPSRDSFRNYVNVSALKHYFNVSNSYVASKIRILLFPWRHRPWSRQQRLSHNGQEGSYLPPREDINSPDMYIPVMAFVTYILLSTVLAGIHGSFDPKLLGEVFFTASVIIGLELSVLWLGAYLLSIPSPATAHSGWLERLCYTCYKFVPLTLVLLLSEIFNRSRGGGTGGWIGWAVFIYAYLANGLFLLRSLRYVLLPDTSAPGVGNAQPGNYTVARSQKNRRTQFLFVYSYVVQFVFMWVLSRQEPARAVVGKATKA